MGFPEARHNAWRLRAPLQQKQQFGLSYLLISHDLAVVEAIADRVAVMHFGAIVELEKTKRLFSAPVHPHTRKLIASAPKIQR
jgi:peptide/nickel transport system ATP-binding protein